MSNASAAAHETRILEAFWSGDIGKSLGLTEDDFDFMISIGNARLRVGKVEEARRIYATLLLYEPSRFIHHQAMANLCLQTGQYEAVLGFAECMCLLEPEDPLGHYFSGSALMALDLRQQAEESLEVALRLALLDGNELLQEDIPLRLQRVRTT